MAGAGYKLFNTGDVLTAAQVNTYLMQQTTMVFASAAARTSALSGVLAEGMVSYLQDTNTLEVYDGSSWVGATGDITGLTAGTGITITSATGPVPTVTNDVATTFDAKGDLVVGTGADTFNKLTVGNNGETLVADSSATTGLRWSSQFVAGKNKLINADFNLNQRGFSSTTTNYTYGFDRWAMECSGGTVTYSAQTFTPGTAPVTGYEAKNFARIVTASQTGTSDFAIFQQRIEDVRTFANQTVTISFWAKASSGTPSVAAEVRQAFDSASGNVFTAAGKTAITTSWARYSLTVSVPSVSGKTIGSSSYLGVHLWTSGGSDYNSRTTSLGLQNTTIDFWGIQIEAGSVATPFSTATGTLAGELAACQRYYVRFADSSASFTPVAGGYGYSDTTTVSYFYVQMPVSMRTKPASVGYANLRTFDFNAGSGYAVSAITVGANSSPLVAETAVTHATATADRNMVLQANNSTSAYLEYSAEL